MTPRLRLALVLHDHQPIGNFDGVFEAAYQDSYLPLVEVLERYPGVPVVLHTSGSLLEWLVEKHPEYIDRIRMLVERGQVEIIGGPFYEPILSNIPRRDRVGQILAFSRYLEKLFGAPVRGMWVPERVWEQSFTSDLAEAGIDYTLLDDYHFRNAGLADEQLFGYYLTEDEGRLVKIFPGSERLRYLIPFKEPDETIEYLRGIAERQPGAVVVFGDDGEKFGTWPGTRIHVYQNGWIHRFFQALQANADWLRVCTLKEIVSSVSPIGNIYLPDGSYREMTEWALPVDRQAEYATLVHDWSHDPSRELEWDRLKKFVRGGFWRNFRVKYSESNEMYARMLLVSERLAELSATPASAGHADLIAEARTELYRAQCNCSYWHGAFGGLYLPHLRNAVYRCLVAADAALDAATHSSGAWARIDAGDYNLDARKEVRLSSDRLAAFISPSCGGHIYELDIVSIRHNLLATLNRRAEVYHDKVRKAGANPNHGHDNHAVSIHDLVAFKQPDLHKLLQYDAWPRKSCVDHFFPNDLTLEQYRMGEGEIGDFPTGVYESVLRRAPKHVQVRMSRTGRFGSHTATIHKTIGHDRNNSSGLDILYELEGLPVGETIHFGVEFNFAGMAAGASDRYYYDSSGNQTGQLQTLQDMHHTDRIGLVDEWLGLDASLSFSQPTSVWAFPIQTVSTSEAGFEMVHQSCSVTPHWYIAVPAGGKWSVRISLDLDTSAAQARKLREQAAVGQPVG
jgi:alpha-amylase